MKETFIPEFLNIPYFLLLNSNITYLDIKVYGIILWFIKASKEKRCILSNAKIQELITPPNKKASGSAIQNSLLRLEKLNYIKRVYSQEKDNRYVRTEIKIISQDTPCVEGGGHLVEKVGHLVEKGFNTSYRRGLTPPTDVDNNNIENRRIYIYENSDQLLKKILGMYKNKISHKATSEEIILTPGVRKTLLDKLQVFKPIDLLFAIEGFSKSPWQMEKNGHRGANWFFQDTNRLEQYIGLYNKARDPVFLKQAEDFLNNI